MDISSEDCLTVHVWPINNDATELLFRFCVNGKTLHFAIQYHIQACHWWLQVTDRAGVFDFWG